MFVQRRATDAPKPILNGPKFLHARADEVETLEEGVTLASDVAVVKPIREGQEAGVTITLTQSHAGEPLATHSGIDVPEDDVYILPTLRSPVPVTDQPTVVITRTAVEYHTIQNPAAPPPPPAAAPPNMPTSTYVVYGTLTESITQTISPVPTPEAVVPVPVVAKTSAKPRVPVPVSVSKVKTKTATTTPAPTSSVVKSDPEPEDDDPEPQPVPTWAEPYRETPKKTKTDGKNKTKSRNSGPHTRPPIFTASKRFVVVPAEATGAPAFLKKREETIDIDKAILQALEADNPDAEFLISGKEIEMDVAEKEDAQAGPGGSPVVGLTPDGPDEEPVIPAKPAAEPAEEPDPDAAEKDKFNAEFAGELAAGHGTRRLVALEDE